jgi:hypothetical protein
MIDEVTCSKKGRKRIEAATSAIATSCPVLIENDQPDIVLVFSNKVQDHHFGLLRFAQVSG